MRPLILLPIAAFLALAACDDAQETAQTEPEATTTAPADTAVAPPPATTGTAPPQDTAAATPPASTAPSTTSPSTTTAPAQDTAAAPADRVDTTGAVSQNLAIEPGAYQSQDVSLNLEQDGTFRLTNPTTGDEAQGQYQQEGTFLTLMTEGQPNEPITCEVVPEGEGFTLNASDPSCEPLDGQRFERQS